jgi:hypothetical protein
MKVKTFTGTDSKKVDSDINKWLADTKVTVVRTNTALKQFNVPMRSTATNKVTKKPVAVVAISVWFNEPKA